MKYLDKNLVKLFKDKDPYELLEQIEGNIYREVKTRKTFQFEFNGKSYFAKLHDSTGWPEIIKNILQFKRPVIGARNEWEAINRLIEKSIATMKIVAYDERGFNPAKRKSFIVTEELQETVSLEDYCLNWKSEGASIEIRKKLIQQVATIASRLHANGICHRDFYLCHFLLHKNHKPFPKLSLIDLHRALIQKITPERWVVKDISGLYYSAMMIGLSKRDLLRFIIYYGQRNNRFSMRDNKKFWVKVERRAKTMFKKLGPAR